MAKAKSVSIEDPDFGNDVVGDNALNDLADVLKNFHKVLPGGDD